MVIERGVEVVTEAVTVALCRMDKGGVMSKDQVMESIRSKILPGSILLMRLRAIKAGQTICEHGHAGIDRGLGAVKATKCERAGRGCCRVNT